jgi:cyclophilin family peptidyl-prolyl cis-trans isomerase
VTGSGKRLRKKENARAAREAREAAVKRARRNRLLVRFGVLFVAFAAVVAVVSFVNRDDDGTTSEALTCVDTVPERGAAADETWDAPPETTIDVERTYTATISTTCGDFDIALDAQNAPNTVNSFVFLAREGFYDGLTFHRLVDDFVIQGGDPNGDGTGDPGYSLPDEPPLEAYGRGSVAMANSGPGTSGSQFFVVLSDRGGSNLGGPPFAYSTLGSVTSGMDVVDELATFVDPDQSPTDPSTESPTRDLYIFSIEITES